MPLPPRGSRNGAHHSSSQPRGQSNCSPEVCQRTHISPHHNHLTSIRNDHCPVACRHLRTHRVPHHHAHEVGARLHVKTGFHREPRAAQSRVCCVQQVHVHDLGKAGDKISILVENSSDDRQLIVVAPQQFPEVDALHVKVR